MTADDHHIVRAWAKTHFGETGHPVGSYPADEPVYVADDEWAVDWSDD